MGSAYHVLQTLQIVPELESAAVGASVEHEGELGEEPAVGGRPEDLVGRGQPVRAREPDVQRDPDLKEFETCQPCGIDKVIYQT